MFHRFLACAPSCTPIATNRDRARPFTGRRRSHRRLGARVLAPRYARFARLGPAGLGPRPARRLDHFLPFFLPFLPPLAAFLAGFFAAFLAAFLGAAFAVFFRFESPTCRSFRA